VKLGATAPGRDGLHWTSGVVWRAQILGFEIFDQIFQTTNLALRVIEYFKNDSGFNLFVDLRAALHFTRQSLLMGIHEVRLS
jgi:hypothetical protein